MEVNVGVSWQSAGPACGRSFEWTAIAGGNGNVARQHAWLRKAVKRALAGMGF
jgi:hypothetical protein